MLLAVLVLTDVGRISPSLSTHLKNFPPKNWTPIIENISQNTRHTRSTLKIEGIAYIRAFTTIWNQNIIFWMNCTNKTTAHNYEINYKRGDSKVFGIALQWVKLQQLAFISLHVLRATCSKFIVLCEVVAYSAFSRNKLLLVIFVLWWLFWVIGSMQILL